MFNYFKKKNERQLTEAGLDDAIAALRSDLRDETLSPSARSAIFEEARRPATAGEAAAHAVFGRRVLIAASLPLVLVVAVLGMLPRSPAPAGHGTRILASKSGASVVFTIEDGQGRHKVLRSTDPAGFDAQGLAVVGNRFTDRAEGGSDLVFYRVD